MKNIPLYSEKGIKYRSSQNLMFEIVLIKATSVISMFIEIMQNSEPEFKKNKQTVNLVQ